MLKLGQKFKLDSMKRADFINGKKLLDIWKEKPENCYMLVGFVNSQSETMFILTDAIDVNRVETLLMMKGFGIPRYYYADKQEVDELIFQLESPSNT